MEENITRLFFSYSKCNSKDLIAHKQNRLTINRIFSTIAISKDNSTIFSTERFRNQFIPSINSIGIINEQKQVMVVCYQPNDRDNKKIYSLLTVDKSNPLIYSTEHQPLKGLEEGVWKWGVKMKRYGDENIHVLFCEDEIVFR